MNRSELRKRRLLPRVTVLQPHEKGRLGPYRVDLEMSKKNGFLANAGKTSFLYPASGLVTSSTRAKIER